MGAMAMVAYAMLAPGDHHSDEVPDDAAGTWLALVRNGTVEAVLETVEVEVHTVRDPVSDHDDEPPTGKRVVIVGQSPSRQVLALLRGPGLHEGRVPLASEPPRPLFPGDRQFLILGDSYVELLGVGSTNHEGLMLDYGLYSTTVPFLPRQRMALERGAGVPSVQLAGDLDRDGRLDFLVATSTHYNVREMTLFLSNGVDGSLRPAAVWRTTGC